MLLKNQHVRKDDWSMCVRAKLVEKTGHIWNQMFYLWMIRNCLQAALFLFIFTSEMIQFCFCFQILYGYKSQTNSKLCNPLRYQPVWICSWLGWMHLQESYLLKELRCLLRWRDTFQKESQAICLMSRVYIYTELIFAGKRMSIRITYQS